MPKALYLLDDDVALVSFVLVFNVNDSTVLFDGDTIADVRLYVTTNFCFHLFERRKKLLQKRLKQKQKKTKKRKKQNKSI